MMFECNDCKEDEVEIVLLSRDEFIAWAMEKKHYPITQTEDACLVYDYMHLQGKNIGLVREGSKPWRIGCFDSSSHQLIRNVSLMQMVTEAYSCNTRMINDMEKMPQHCIFDKIRVREQLRGLLADRKAFSQLKRREEKYRLFLYRKGRGMA